MAALCHHYVSTIHKMTCQEAAFLKWL